MLTKEYTILEPFTRALWTPLTFRDVKELSCNKSDNYVHTTLKCFVKSGVLLERKVGNNILYFVSNDSFALNTIGYIAEFKAHECGHIPHKNMQKIMNKIKNAFYSFIITGSYATKTHKNTSDIDFVIICDDNQDPDGVLSQIMLESDLMTPQGHPYVFTQSQLLGMLTSKEENYGKELTRNNQILTGAKQYYFLLMEAINHGFKGYDLFAESSK